MDDKPKILIGFLTKGYTGSIQMINRQFIDGLKSRYHFIPHYADRYYGNENISKFTPYNLYYFIKHFFSWTYKLVKYSPDLSHYPISSNWGFEKGSCFFLVSWIFRVKAVGHLHSGEFKEFHKKLSGFRKVWMTFIMRRVLNHVIVLSSDWQYWVIYTFNIPADKVSVVGNPIDKDFEKSVINNRRDFGDIQTILCFSVMSFDKGVKEILEAFKYFSQGKNVELILAGPERGKNVLKFCYEFITINKLKNKVKVLGPIYADQKVKLFKEASIFLYPSHFESYSLVVFEAAASGLPIISTKVGVIPEYFKHKKSILFVEINHVNEIILQLENLYLNKKLRETLGCSAQEIVMRNVSNQNIFIKLDSVYNKILNT